jgi:hypothetical protein
MKRRTCLIATMGLMAVSAAFVCGADKNDGVPVSVLLTLEPQQRGTGATLTSDDLQVKENKANRAVTAVRSLTGSKTQMLFLLDDSAGGSLDTQISTLKQFINGLPASFEVGVGYMHNGTAQMASTLTADHAKAAQSIRLPLGPGGADVSPYDSLAEVAKQWPQEDGVDRREVVMISSGIEGLGGGLPPENPYVNAGVEAAQKAGLVVYCIYNPLFGHEGHSFWRASWGQNFLSQLADATGGELYQEGFTAAVSYQPFLNDIMKRQSEQYLVSFMAGAENKSQLQPIKISSTEKSMSLAAPEKVWVKANM